MTVKCDWIDLEQIEKLAAKGLFQYQVAEALNICRDTWFQAIKEGRTDVSDAYRRGKAKLAPKIMDLLIKKAEKGNVKAMIFIAKSQLGIRDNDDLNKRINPDLPPPPTASNAANLTPEERRNRIAILEAKRRGESV